MTSEIELVDAAEPPARRRGQWLIRNGAELVHLVEQLYVNFLTLVLVLMLVGCGLSVTLGSLNSPGSPGLLTLLFAGVGAAFCAFGLWQPVRVYCWLRYRPVRQVTPAAVAAVALVLNSPDSASWWVALPLLWIVAVVGSTRLLAAGALVAGSAYLAGTSLAGQPLIEHGDTGILAAGIGLPVNAIVGRFASEVLARFVLRLHQLEQDLMVAEPAQPPIRVPNLAAPLRVQRSPVTTRQPAESRQPADRAAALHLTARQLEAVLLARDGLHQSEIAVCLGVSVRQVERLMHDARWRSGAQTLSQLVAMVVSARVAPGGGA